MNNLIEDMKGERLNLEEAIDRAIDLIEKEDGLEDEDKKEVRGFLLWSVVSMINAVIESLEKETPLVLDQASREERILFHTEIMTQSLMLGLRRTINVQSEFDMAAALAEFFWNDRMDAHELAEITKPGDHYCQRWPILARIPAAIRFVSYEPALAPLGPLDISVGRVPDWLAACALSQ